MKISMNNFFILCSIVLIIIMVIPSSFATDDNLSSNDAVYEIYFDSNALDDKGDGSFENPYKTLRDGRIIDNCIIHFANGEYNLTSLNSHKNISFNGNDTSKTIINGNGGPFVVNTQFLLNNITINNLNIFNQGNIKATNTIFSNSNANEINNGYSFGGAIYCVDFTHNAYLTNCTFINNSADFGGAIYLNGGNLDVIDCIFMNNMAYNYGGAIACERSQSENPVVSIKKSKFINCYSINDAGGGVYLKSTQFTGDKLNFTSCSANFGGALTLLSSDSYLSDIYGFNNTARYDGGVIYGMFKNLTIINSNFTCNNAKNGAVLFISNTDSTIVENNSFKNNTATLYAGVMYLILNNTSQIEKNFYSNNKAKEYNNSYEINAPLITFYSSNYTLYYNLNTQSQLPKFYSSIEEGYVTSVKDQSNGGNCWAFAAISTLESAILKASRNYFDLSEEHMKNLASLYSNYGWTMDTNNGGYDDMALGYLISWLGPVFENEDKYCDKSVLSPVLDPVLHVQNVELLKKSTYYDLDSIKQAIMDYGAVGAGIYMMASYNSQINAYVQCYRGSHPCDHAVVLVGWDDNFVIPNAPGKGAWIVKNSWGSSWGNEGYFYLSYFDNSCPKLNEDGAAYAFILNDTIKYDKNYQYDIIKTDYFLNTTNTVWFKNIFNATDNEYLAAVSTYFKTDSNWEVVINVNNSFKSLKTGYSHAGYHTINLDKFVPLHVGDIFEVIFKITADDDVGVPISEAMSLTNCFYRENISFISYDGINWQDLYELEWEYPDHTYSSQVACIKAFTILNPINTTLDLNVYSRSQNNITLLVNVFNQYSFPITSGEITFKLNGENHTSKLENGVALILINTTSGNLTCEFKAEGYNPSSKTVEIKNHLINTDISLNFYNNHNPLSIFAYIADENLNPVTTGFITFNINNKNYTVDVVGGYANLSGINITPGEIMVNAFYNDSFYYNSSFATKSINISRINTIMKLNISSNEYNNPVNVMAMITDLENNTVNSGRVIFKFNDENHVVFVKNGIANITHTFLKTGLNTIDAYYLDDYIYNSSYCNATVNSSKINVNLIFTKIIDKNLMVFGITIANSTRGFEILLNLNNKTYTYKSTEKYVIMELKDLDDGIYNYTISLVSQVYKADDICGNFTINHVKTQIVASNDTIYYNGDYSIVLKDRYGDILPDQDVYLKINGKTYKNRTNNDGICIFHIGCGVGEFSALINYIGDDEHIDSKLITEITVKSSIEVLQTTFTQDSNCIINLKDNNGNQLQNKLIDIELNGCNYNLKTNNKGEAFFNIQLQNGFYSLKIKNLETGEVAYSNIRIVNRISYNHDLTTYYLSDKKYSVRICDDYGNFVSGVKLTFIIGSKSYYVFSDKNGYVTFNKILKPGTYTITAKYKSYEVSNKIIIKSTIITKNISLKKGKPIKFTAKLLNSNGKILKNKKIIFKFKGKTYKIKTNNKGIATLNINKKYKIGRYTIISKYESLTVKNKIIIKK